MRVLIADDDATLAGTLSSFLKLCGHDVVATVTTGSDTLRLWGRYEPDLVLAEALMPNFTGLTVCDAIRRKDPQALVVLYSGRIRADHPRVARSGATAFLRKPVRLGKLRQLLTELAEIKGQTVKTVTT